MRILLSCLQDLRPHQIPAYRFWADYFRNGIREAGHDLMEVPGVDWAEGISNLPPGKQSKWREETWSRTVDLLAREQKDGRTFDLFLSYLYPAQVEPAAIKEMQRFGVRCVNFFCDNVREFRQVPAAYRSFDLHWVPEFEALPMYRKARVKHVHAPMPVWVAPENRCASVHETEEVTFIGSEDLLRRQLLGEAIQLGAAITIRGRGWAEGDVSTLPPASPRTWYDSLKNQATFIRQRGAVEWLRKTARRWRPESRTEIAKEHLAASMFVQDYVRVTKESRVVIGINRVPTFSHPLKNPLKYSRLRDIEAPMMGACYLTEWTEGLSQMFELGTEIECYRTAVELAGKIEELQADPGKRKRMRRLGQQRASTDLTIAKSLEKIWAAI